MYVCMYELKITLFLSRRLWVRVDCRPGNGTDNEPLETVAVQSVDFHVSGDVEHATRCVCVCVCATPS
jgi:hypothetical protein